MMMTGRKKIVTNYTSDDIRMSKENLISAINDTFMVHMGNKLDIDYLIGYSKGRQSIKNKIKTVRPEINNKIVLNHAQMVTRTITGYFLGTPIQYVQSNPKHKEAIDRLNQIVQYEDKASVDKELAEMQSICGTAYRIIYSDGIYGDDVPFEDRMLNPSTTYVAYYNDISENPVMAVTYIDIIEGGGKVGSRKFYIYTDFGRYDCITDASGLPTMDTEFNFIGYNVGGIPIIEYPNNIWRIGDWELYIDLMDAVNTLHSGRMDDIEQVVQSLIVFINADIDKKRYDEMREAGVVTLTNNQNNKTEVKMMGNSLDQTSSSAFSNELESLIYALIGIPDRNDKTGGGGDTGQAVELRDGWAELEIVARNKELTFMRSEKQSLKIMLSILNSKEKTGLSVMDIVIKFNRNKNNNLLVKTQAYMNLIQTKTLDPSDCLTIVDLVSDVNDFMERGKLFWGDNFAGKAPEPEINPLLGVKEPENDQKSEKKEPEDE